MLDIIYNRFYFILLSIIILLIDQLSKSLISIYSKTLINKDFILFSLDYVKNFGAAFDLFSGNRFFLSLVSIVTTILLIYFTNHESQGLATGEAWSCNTPTLIWNNKKTFIGNYEINSSCCPYMNDQCGNFFSDFQSFKKIFSKSIKDYSKYAPRKWILENMTYEISIRNLINLVNSKIKI